MNKIGVGLLAYNSEPWIRNSAGCLQPYVDKLCVKVDNKTTDRTREILDEMSIPHSDFQWTHNYADAKNLLVKELEGCDWMIFLDDDEMYSDDGGKALVEFVRSIDNPNIHGLEIPMKQKYPSWNTEPEDYMKEFGFNPHLSVFKKGYQFVNKIHESVAVPEENRIKFQFFVDRNIFIYHHAWKGNREKYEAPKHFYYKDLSEGKTFQDGEHLW